MPANTGKNIDIHRHFKMTSQHDKEQMMKGIPASYIPTICIQELAITMDPKSDMPGKDYRHFAELNGILPKEWQYLDSQKCQGSTSSFYNVMQWLMHQHDDCFTVFTVYETFKKMESRGTKILDKYLPGGWLGVHLVGRQMDMDITRSFMRQEMNNLPPHVLIVGGDEKDPEGLSGEIHSLCDFLHQKDITCVAVFPSDQMPLSQQWKAYQELEAFIQECYLKARKIVVAISPGYNEYAEEHRNGARASATLHQKIIRQLHEKMKEEYIKIRYQSKSRKTRLIPVLLTKLKTKAHHCPDFLQLIKCNKFELNTSSRLPLHRYFPGNHEKLLSLITSK